MRLWIDLANSPHVPFFRPLIAEFERRGHSVATTARDYAQTVELAERAHLGARTIGGHGGGRLRGKAGNLFSRALSLRSWARSDEKKFDLAVSHNSYAQIVAARSLGVETVTLMDYEHQPANHLAFRLASRVIVPAAFPAAALARYGARAKRVRRYAGIKEDVYLADFKPDPEFAAHLMSAHGVAPDDVLVVVRPPASEALYHRFENELFDALLGRLLDDARVKILLLARTREQRRAIAAKHRRRAAAPRLIFPEVALDGANLIAAADLVVSAGGTMNREAAALGTPAATVYAGRWAAIDEQLVREKRLARIATREDIEGLPIEKKNRVTAQPARRDAAVRAQVADLILGVTRE